MTLPLTVDAGNYTDQAHVDWHNEIDVALPHLGLPTVSTATTTGHLAAHEALHVHIATSTLPVDVNQNDPGHYGDHQDIHAYLTPATSKLRWAPPDTTGWTQITAPSGGQTFNLPSTSTDYIINNPAGGIVNRCVTVVGGRNWIWKAGHSQIDTVWADAESAQASIRIYDAGSGSVNRQVWLEGWLADGSQQAGDIQTNCPTAEVYVQNCRIVQSYSFTAGVHPDIIQTWGGHRGLFVDKVTGLSRYQGLQIPRDLADVGPTRIRRVNIKGTGSNEQRYLWWIDEANDTIYTAGELYVDPASTRSLVGDVGSGTVWPEISDGTVARRPVKATDAHGTYCTYPNLNKTVGGTQLVRNWENTGSGQIRQGVPTVGDWCPAGLAGASYVSPGYLT